MKSLRRSSLIGTLAILTGLSFFKFTATPSIAEGARAPGAAEDEYFKIPSGNIHCRANTSDNTLECEIQTNNAKLPPKPQDCELDWGNRFYMTLTGKAERSCHGDTLGLDPKNPVLAYGKTWKQNGFTCISKQTGLTCKNKAGRGWTLSKSNQEFF